MSIWTHRTLKKKPLAQPLDTLALLAAIEPLRDEVLEDVLRSPASETEPTLPLPKAPQWLAASLPPIAEDVSVERIARRVPPECLYLRFGSFNNYVWFQELTTRFGGDISQAVFMRGFNYEASARMERMLGAKLTAIAKMFGDKLIDDMALIGTDLYFKEGGSLGSILSTNNAALLMTTLQSDRQAAMKANPGATIETVQIAGRDVSLLSTPTIDCVPLWPAMAITFLLLLAARDAAILGSWRGRAEHSGFTVVSMGANLDARSNQYSVFAFSRLSSFTTWSAHSTKSNFAAHGIDRTSGDSEVASRAARAESIPGDDIASMQAAGLLPSWLITI